MTFGEAISSGFSNYANFNDRASRSAYWWWALFAFIVGIVASVVAQAADIMAISWIVSLVFFVPGISVAARRLHDIGKSGWNQLWSLTIIGIVYVIYLLVQPGDPAENKYGPPPVASASSQPM